jgi:hypothetical protein
VFIDALRNLALGVAANWKNAIVLIFDVGVKSWVAQVGLAASAEVVALACGRARSAFLLAVFGRVLVRVLVGCVEAWGIYCAFPFLYLKSKFNFGRGQCFKSEKYF